VSVLENEFPGVVDFSSVEGTVWPDKSPGTRFAFSRDAVLARARSAVERLRSRPEKLVIVVSHSGFLRVGVTGCWFFNADYRRFEHVDVDAEASNGHHANGDDHDHGHIRDHHAPPPNPSSLLLQWESTRLGRGGRGLSWTNEVKIGSYLTDEPV